MWQWVADGPVIKQDCCSKAHKSEREETVCHCKPALRLVRQAASTVPHYRV